MRLGTGAYWNPQPGPQKALIDCGASEVFFGGARGGGKTDGVLGKYALKAQRYLAGFNAAFFRRELPMLDDAIERSAAIYRPMGASWREQKKSWKFPGGGRLKFRPLERASDAEKYQGQNLSDACVEEAGNYPDSAPIDRLNGVLRSADGVPTQLLLTGNPGGAGQHWIKARYIDPDPQGMTILHRILPGGLRHDYVFIPSKVSNNRILLDADPGYIARLHLVGSPELVRAWLNGDWSVIAGAFFPEFNIARHVVTPFRVPTEWLRARSADWGSARPFSIGWWAIADGEPYPGVPSLPRGCLVRYREWYGASAPNVGLRMTAEEVADGIIQREAAERITYGVLDPAAFSQDGGPSIAERMERRAKIVNRTLAFRPADNARVARQGHVGGWDLLRQRLKGEGPNDPPMIVFFSTCTDTIRTLPALQHDADRPEDVDSDAEDHAADEVRYMCASRPWIAKTTKPLPVLDMRHATIEDLWRDRDRRMNVRGRIA